MDDNYLFNTNSPEAEAIANLFGITLIAMGVILVLVSALVFYCVVRFRARPGQPEPRQVRGHVPLEVAWILVPFLLLVYLFIITVNAMRASHPPTPREAGFVERFPGAERIRDAIHPPTPNVEPDLIVVGHQFWWEIRYPKLGIVTANEIRMPVGQRLLIRLESADVLHNFWVPQLARKMYMIPNNPNFMWLQASRPGVYNGACGEFCGVQHAWMRLYVFALPEEKFAEWVKIQQQPAPPPTTPAAIRGQQIYRELTCVNCHPAEGTPAPVLVGPDLTHLALRETLGAGVLRNTPENLALWIRYPQRVKPGNLMPNMQLTDEQVAAMVAYFLRLP